MSTLKNKSGFTLLEIIIVIIIVGVLASLALPRLFATVEFSRSAEAMASMASIRSSLERCYLQNGATYIGCNLTSGGVIDIDIEDPADSPNAHFTYEVSGQSAAGYTITATRNAVDGGDGASTVIITQTAATVDRDGTGKFESIK